MNFNQEPPEVTPTLQIKKILRNVSKYLVMISI